MTETIQFFYYLKKFTWRLQSHLVIPEMLDDRWNASGIPVDSR